MLNYIQRAAYPIAAIGVVAFATLTIAPPPADAQSAEMLAQGEEAPIDEAAIQDFVTAAKSVVALRREYEPRLRSAPNEEAAQEIVEEARGRMAAAIVDTGMTLERYLEIAEAAQADPALRARIEEMVGVE